MRPVGVLCVVPALVAACTTAPPGPTTTTSATAAATATVTATPTAPAPPTAPPAAPQTVVMWARGGLPAEVATRAAALPGVLGAAHVRSDSLGLTGSRDAAGHAVDVLDRGWRIPVEVMAVDPSLAELLPVGPTRDAVAALAPGQVLLPASSAERRGVGAGGQLDLVGRPGLRVADVVEDDVLGRAEVVVHAADADAVGLDADGSLRVLHDGTRASAVAEQLEALAPPETAVRVVATSGDQPARRAALVLGLPEVKDRFGEFAFRDDDADREIRPDAAWVDAHIVGAQVPLLGQVRCHEAIVDDLAAALQAVADAGFGHTIDRDRYGGCYHPRRIGTGSRLSHHAWGIAIDINVDMSQPGFGPAPPAEVVDLFAAHGFRWGGLFLSPDNHHFEWVGQQARRPPAGAPDGA